MAARLTPAQQDRYRRVGWIAAAGSLPEERLEPVREIAAAVARQAPDQDMLSGIHNPFGYHACCGQAWSFLDIAESDALLDPVEDLLGPDIVLWDSELYFDLAGFVADEVEWWPVEPLAGVIAVISLEQGDFALIDIVRLATLRPALPAAAGPHFAVRYMPATSHFNRDPRCPANRRAAAARPLVNYARRPIWLVRGADRGDNDFATGFAVPAAEWAISDG